MLPPSLERGVDEGGGVAILLLPMRRRDESEIMIPPPLHSGALGGWGHDVAPIALSLLAPLSRLWCRRMADFTACRAPPSSPICSGMSAWERDG